MMKIFYKNLIGTALAFGLVAFASVSIMAQNMVSSEDFAGDIPTGWVSGDASGGTTLWTWCGDPVQSVGAGCIANWATYSNQHGTFESTSAGNGFMVVDSDGAGGLATNHQSTLTMPSADYSGLTDVWVKFEALIGVFENGTAGNVLVRASNDGGTNWTNYEVVDIAPGNTGNETGLIRWTENPGIFLVDVSDVAAGQADVQIQFWWEGNYEYYYLLDDVAIFDADPSFLFFPLNDIAVDNFHSIAPNAQTPSDQLVEMSFLADVSNQGLVAAANVVTTVSIVDDANSAEVFSSTLNMGEILTDTLNQNLPFPDKFTPAATVATYTGTYSTVSDSTDESPDNNAQVFNFGVTDNVFAKENAPTRALAPAAGNWDAGENQSWAIGNFYKTPNGAGRYANRVWFGINNAAEVAGEIAIVKLYSWTDDNGDDIPGQDELVTLSFTFYEITGDEVANELFPVDLLDEAGGSLGEIELADGGQYIAMVEYTGSDALHTLNVAASDVLDYTAQVFQDTTVSGMDAPYYTYFMSINDPITDIPWDNSFGLDIQPAIRLEIGDTPIGVNTEELFSAEEIFLSPNPAKSYIQLNVNLDEVAQDAHVSIISAAGQRVAVANEGAIQNNSFTYDVTNLSAGQYFLILRTELGSATRPFSVVK